MPENLPPLDTCGFVRVPGDAELWMTCDACGKSDHFWFDEEVHCRCGARYGHAIRPDGSKVAFDELTFVAFADGPKALADLVIDPKRVALLIGVVVALLGGLGWWLFG
jgi:hypothetical protein